MHAERTVLDLVGLVYEAAGDASRWPAFLQTLGETLHATASNIFVQNLQSQEFIAAAAIGIDAAFQRSYEDYYKSKNVFLARGHTLLRTGRVYPSQALCPDRIALCTEFFNDWIAPQRHRHGMVGVIYRKRSLASVLGAIRAKGARPFGAEEVGLIRLLIPHLQRAVSLHRKIADLEKQKSAAGAALDHWSLAVILIDGRGRVLLMNRKAEEIARQKDGFLFTADRVCAGLHSETATLHNLIHDAIATRLGHGGKSGGAMTLSRPSLKRPLNALVAPLFPHGTLAVHRGAAAVLFVSDPDDREETDADALRALYGLTPAEATLTGRLLTGEDLRCAAEALDVSMNTARTHLKKIFEKTGTKRQAELVRLALRSPAQIRVKA